MRILLLIKRFNFGGSENHVCDLANSLAEIGHEVWLLSRHGRQVQRLSPLVRFREIYLSDVRLLIHLVHLRKFILQNDIQLIHAHQRLAIKIAGIVGRLVSIPVIATVHGQTRHDLGGPMIRKKLNRVIFVSNQVLRRGARFKELRGKSVYIPNSIAEKSCSGDLFSKELVYISRIDKRHSSLLLMLIEQVMPALQALFPNASLRIIGDGRMGEKVRQAADGYNAKYGAPSIKWVGFQSEPNRCIYGAALVMGVGRVATQALAQAIPVLSLNYRHQGPFISMQNYQDIKQRNFVCTSGGPPTPQSLTNALVGFLQHPHPWQDEVSKLRTLVLKDHGCRVILDQTEWVYREALKESCAVDSIHSPETDTALPAYSNW